MIRRPGSFGRDSNRSFLTFGQFESRQRCRRVESEKTKGEELHVLQQLVEQILKEKSSRAAVCLEDKVKIKGYYESRFLTKETKGTDVLSLQLYDFNW